MRHGRHDPAAQPGVEPHPGVEGQPVVARPRRVALDGHERVALLPGRADAGDDRPHPSLTGQRTHPAGASPPDRPLPWRAGSTTIWSAPSVSGARPASWSATVRRSWSSQPSRQPVIGAVPDEGRGVGGGDDGVVGRRAAPAGAPASCPRCDATPDPRPESWSMNVGPDGPVEVHSRRRPGPAGSPATPGGGRRAARTPGSVDRVRAGSCRRRSAPPAGAAATSGTRMEPSGCW